MAVLILGSDVRFYGKLFELIANNRYKPFIRNGCGKPNGFINNNDINYKADIGSCKMFGRTKMSSVREAIWYAPLLP